MFVAFDPSHHTYWGCIVAWPFVLTIIWLQKRRFPLPWGFHIAVTGASVFLAISGWALS